MMPWSFRGKEVMNQELLTQIEQIVGVAAGTLRTDIGEVRRHTDAAMEVLRTDITEVKRHTGVLIEGLRQEFNLVTEGFQMHLDRCHVDDREHLDNQFRETRSLIHLSYGQLQERVDRLEQRVRVIEQHLGFSV